MRVLVVGGKGFIGKHVCAELEVQGIEFKTVDLKDGLDICSCMIAPGCFDAMILLAADLGHEISMYQKNLRIYEWLAKVWTIPHVVYASSAAVYSDGIPGIESYIPYPPTLYGQSKLLGETILQSTQKSYTILRLANVYSDGEGNGAIDAFKRGEKTIFGDGTDVRDYVSVKVVAKAFVRVALNPDRYNGEIFNISTAEPMTTLEAFRKYGTGEPVHLNPRPYDTHFSLLLNGKAKEAGLI